MDSHFAVIRDAEQATRMAYNALADHARNNQFRVTGQQAFIIATMEDGRSVTELMTEGIYSGANASYNVKKLLDLGLITSTQSTQDRRIVILRRTSRGKQLAQSLTAALPELLPSYFKTKIGVSKKA